MKNPYLRVKLKSLAEEARIIRIEEQRAVKAQNYELQGDLRYHRISKVRQSARETLLAYQYLRNIPYLAVEKENSTIPDWKSVLSMVKKYGPTIKVEIKDLETWSKQTLKQAA